MDNQAAARVKEFISKNDKIAVLVGKNPSLDQMAGALSLYLALQQLGKHVSIASPTQPIVANSSLVGIDKVKTVLAGDGGDLIVSFPYREGEIEKVSYTLEDGYLNIVVKATEEGLSFQQQDVLFKRSGGIPGLAFIVGTARLSDLGSLFDADALKNTAVINIDNQNDNQGFGDVVLVSAQASSLSEVIGRLLEALQIEIDKDIAQNLLSGLSQATNNFQNADTSFMAFEMAAAYMKKGAKRISLGQAKQQDGLQSPFGPFTMPQGRSALGQQQGGVRQSPSQQPREQRSSAQQRGERPWDQRQANASSQSRPPLRNEQSAASSATPPSRDGQRDDQVGQEIEHKEAKPARNELSPQATAGGEEPEAPSDWLSPKVYKSSTLI